jgi:PhnB protein
MPTALKTPPFGYHTATPYLNVKAAVGLIAFMQQVFDAEVAQRLTGPDREVAHAELRIGDSLIMLSEASDNWPAMPAAVHLYVDDADATYRRALAAGAASVLEPSDQFYGDRMAGVKDPFGNVWWLATRLEDVPRDEMERRAAQAWAQP